MNQYIYIYKISVYVYIRICTIYMYIHLVLISRISRIPERAFGYYFPISRTVQCTGNLIPLPVRLIEGVSCLGYNDVVIRSRVAIEPLIEKTVL